MNRCPNYLVCGGVESNHYGVCFSCDNSLYGYSHKLQDIYYGIRPTVDEDPGRDFYHYHDRKLSNIQQKQLLEQIKIDAGILKIEEVVEECPICLDEKNIFVYHPTCKIHKICDVCFKMTFLNKHIQLQEPQKPEGYEIFDDFIINSDDICYTGDPDVLEHLGGYNCYVLQPPDGWPDEIINLYDVCSLYDRQLTEYYNDMDESINESENLRACNICRERELKI